MLTPILILLFFRLTPDVAGAPAAPAAVATPADTSAADPITPSPSADSAQDPAKLWESANRAYQEERYVDALAGYEALQSRGIIAAELYYNLANAYFKLGNLGHAVLFYYRAQRLSPADPDIRNNLDMAMKQRVDPPIEGEDEIFGDSFKQLIWRLNSSSVYYCSLFFLFLAGVASLLLILRPEIGKWAGYLLVVGSVIGLLTLGLSFLQSRERARQDEAIIVAESLDVLAGPTTRESINFTIHEGMRCQILEEQPGWLRIRLANGFNGWIERTGAERI